jgi:hypothetical chaperone protein
MRQPSPPPVRSLGLDFGTTNSVAVFRGADGIRTASFPDAQENHSVFRTALSFWRDRETSSVNTEAGPWAIQRFIADPEACRFLQSFKTFAASAAFRSTIIHGKTYRFEDLMAAFIETMSGHADQTLIAPPQRLMMGRPVTFAGLSPKAALAEERYDAALAQAGFGEVHYVYEPVAAAFYFAQRLKRDATVLVADFGGGTSDFSIINFTLETDGIRAHPLAQSGVGIAGDRFDYRIIDNVASPTLGKGSRYKSFDKMLDVPSHYFANFARWNQLAVMKSGSTLRELRQLARASEEPERLEKLIEIIEEDLGYPLYKAVSETKFALSSQERARLTFHSGSIAIDAEVDRRDFERWIAPDIAEIEGAVEQALATAGLPATAIDKVFLTGGSSFVPAVRRLFEHRFGAKKIETGEQLLSIAYGLALIGEQEDLERWTVREPKVAA